MQNFGSDSGNTVSPQEAKEILATWTNQRQAQGVDPSVNSVASLASGLGVSEAEVRQMLEDIRVHHRSQEMAAGIVDEQLKHRKRSDINAAVIAAAVIFFLVLIGGAAFYFKGAAGAGPIPPPAQPNAPPDFSSKAFPFDSGKTITHASRDGNVTTFNGNTASFINSNGSVLSLSGQAAIEETKKRIPLTEKLIEDLSAKKNPTADEESDLEDNRTELSTLQQGLKSLQDLPKPP